MWGANVLTQANLSESGADLRAEVARVGKLVSEAQHAATAAIFMGGTGKEHIARRDTLLAHVKQACLASDDEREKHLAILRGLQ